MATGMMQSALDQITRSLPWLLPELSVVAVMLTLLLLILISLSAERLLKPLMLAGLMTVFCVSVLQMNALWTNEVCCLREMLVIDLQTAMWKIILSAAMLIVILFPLPYALKRVRAEYYLLLLGVLLGGFILISAQHFLMVIIGLELMSLSSYMLAGLARTKGSTEAALKYFLFGAAATAVTIYGMSWMYGLTGEVSLSGTYFPMSGLQGIPDWIAYLVVTMVSAGILFKVAAAPWHLWVPDVYQETPTPVVAMFSVIPKLAGLAFLARWIAWIGWPLEIVAGLAMLTLAIGNFAALRQNNVKRMMGYSSIAHSGFLLMALLSPGDLSFLMFYAVVYILMNLGAFLLINYYERMYRVSTFSDYSGFFGISPYFGVMMIILMIALTGLPPTAGFSAKLFVFSSVATTYGETENSWVLAAMIFGIVNAVISFAYYVRLPYQMVFKKMTSAAIVFKKYSSMENFLCIILVLAVLILFFKPEWLMGWINNSSFAF